MGATLKSVLVVCNWRPVPKARPRLGRWRVFTPPRTQAAEDALVLAMRDACPEPLEGPLAVTMTFEFAHKKAPPSPEARLERPDLDNLVKLVLDAGNHVLWEDDAQIYRLYAAKYNSGLDLTRIEVARHDNA